MASTAVLVFPGASRRLVEAHLPQGARVYAVDAGAEPLRQAGIVPDVLVGDLDSVTGETLAWAKKAGARIDRHPAAKRDPDGALALALAQDATRIIFLGAGGGRSDHAFANLHLLWSASRRADAVAHDEDATTWIATPERPLDLALPEGSTLSMLPFGTSCSGITYASLGYPLEDATMEAGDPYGVSNVCGPPPQRIRVAEGALVVIAPHAV